MGIALASSVAIITAFGSTVANASVKNKEAKNNVQVAQLSTEITKYIGIQRESRGGDVACQSTLTYTIALKGVASRRPTTRTQRKPSKESIERLSTGLKVNKGSDAPAGL